MFCYECKEGFDAFSHVFAWYRKNICCILTFISYLHLSRTRNNVLSRVFFKDPKKQLYYQLLIHVSLKRLLLR